MMASFKHLSSMTALTNIEKSSFAEGESPGSNSITDNDLLATNTFSGSREFFALQKISGSRVLLVEMNYEGIKTKMAPIALAGIFLFNPAIAQAQSVRPSTVFLVAEPAGHSSRNNVAFVVRQEIARRLQQVGARVVVREGRAASSRRYAADFEVNSRIIVQSQGSSRLIGPLTRSVGASVSRRKVRVIVFLSVEDKRTGYQVAFAEGSAAKSFVREFGVRGRVWRRSERVDENVLLVAARRATVKAMKKLFRQIPEFTAYRRVR